MATTRLGFRYEVALDPPLVVDTLADGRLTSLSPIASSPFNERGTDRRIIELNDDADLKHELMNAPGNVPTKLTAYLWGYVAPFKFTLPPYYGASSEVNALCPSQTIPITNLPNNARITLSDTSLLASDFVLSYREKGSTTFTAIRKADLPFLLPSDTEAIRYRFRVPGTAGQFKYYGIVIGGQTQYFAIGANPAVTRRFSVEVDDVTRVEPFGTNTSNLAFSFDYDDANDIGKLAVIRDGNDYVITALEEGTVPIYLNSHPLNYSGTGTRIKAEFTVTHKITNDQLIGGEQYNLPRIPLESGEAVSFNLTGYLGNITHTPRFQVSNALLMRASIVKQNNKFILTVTGAGTPSASGTETNISISQDDDEGNTLEFEIPFLIQRAVTGSKTGTIAGLYDVNDLSRVIRLPKGITSYKIDLSKYDWETFDEDITSIDSSTFSLVASTDTHLATFTLTNDSIVTVNTDTSSTAEGQASQSIDVEDGETQSINILVTNIKGDTPLKYPDTSFSVYEYVTDPEIPADKWATPTGPYVDGDRLILQTVHGYLGEVEINDQEQIVITEIPFLDTELVQKTLGSLFVDDGLLFDLPGQLASKDTVVNWPSQWVEV